MKPNLMCWLVLIGVCSVSGLSAEDSKPREAATAPSANQSAAVDRLAEVIEQVREAEERYRNLETFVRVTSQDEVSLGNVNDKRNLSKSEETSYMLQQGDLFLFKWRDVRSYGGREPMITEQIAAFDGETTHYVVYGNSVNVFKGRHEPPRLYPPHTWCLRTLWVNYPLSVYLQGTEAIKKHPKSFQSPAQRGRVFEIAKVEVSFVGDEELDGLKCVKLQSRHWNREKVTPKISGIPEVAQIWLARDRGYLCAQVSISPGEGFQGARRNETKVTQWSEVQPGIWLPKQIETVHYITPRNGGKEVVRRRETLSVEKASAAADRPREQFAGVKSPLGLPIFKIDRDGFLEGSTMRSVAAPAGDRHELARIITELKRQEQRYARYDVSTTATYRAFEARRMPGATTSIVEAERTISLPGKLYSDCLQEGHGTIASASASASPGLVADSPLEKPRHTLSRNEGAWDGQWIRSFNWYSNEGELAAAPSSTNLQKGGPKGLIAFRPHTAIFSDNRIRRRLLSDYLTAEVWDENNSYRHLVEYVGEETVNDLACAKLRLGSLFGDEKTPTNQFLFVWLARDRNYLPVRTESAELAWSDHLPTGVAYVDDLREAAPGTWFPYHVVEIAHDNWDFDGTGSGQILINWRRERQVDNLNLEPDVPDELFAPAAPPGTWMHVSDESGRNIGRLRQKEDVPAKVGDDKYQVMAEIARVNRRDSADRKRRQEALDALVGTPWPNFSEARWLNGPPPDGDSLAGKVLLIEFCAEWWLPCHGALEKLGKADRDLALDGLTVIGVHTAGSARRDIEELANELDLNFPIYVDAPAPGGKSRWGRLFEQLGVRELPHTFVVGRDGKIAAHGALDQMIRRAQALAEKE